MVGTVECNSLPNPHDLGGKVCLMSDPEALALCHGLPGSHVLWCSGSEAADTAACALLA